MRSKLSFATKFCDWIYEEVLPSIRQQQGTELFVRQFQKYIESHPMTAETNDNDTGYFYVACCPSLAENGCLKIGKTLDLNSRLSSYNCGRHLTKFMYYLYIKKNVCISVR